MGGKIIIGLNGTTLNMVERKLLSDSSIVGVIGFSRNYRNKDQIIRLISSIQAIRSTNNLPRAIIFLDHEGGFVQRFRNDIFTKLPAAADIGKLFCENTKDGYELVQNIALITAIELGCVGIDVILGPVLDLSPTKKNRMNSSRFYEADPLIIGKVSECYIQELQKYGLNAAPKHFPGTGGNAIDSHFRIALSDRSLNNLLHNDLAPYQLMSARTGLRAIMLSHGVYWRVDQRPVNNSSIWLNDVLKQHLGFNGVIITDCIQMIGSKINHTSLTERIIASLDAGCDLILCSHLYIDIYQEFYAAMNHPRIKNHTTPKSKINKLMNRNDPAYYFDLMTTSTYIDAKKAVTDFNGKKQTLNSHQKTRLNKLVFRKNLLKYRYTLKLTHWVFRQKKIDHALMLVLRYDYQLRLSWLKLKNFIYCFIRDQ